MDTEGDVDSILPTPAVEASVASTTKLNLLIPPPNDLEPPSLLLPNHVFISEPSNRLDGETDDRPPSPALSMTSDIQFIDDDRPVRAFLLKPKPETQP